jgi:hypothetical protein
VAAVTSAAATTSFISLSSSVAAGTSSAIGTTLPSHDPGGQGCFYSLLLYTATPASRLLLLRALPMLLDKVGS